MAQLLRESRRSFGRRSISCPACSCSFGNTPKKSHEDAHLRVSRLPADGLSADDMHYLLDNFFMVHPDHNIRPYPRYNELYEKRGLRRRSGGTSGQTVFKARHSRSAMLVEPGLDSSAGV